MYHARRDAAGFSNPGGLAVQWCEYTGMHFASFLSGGFTTMAVMNPPEKKLEKHTSVHCCKNLLDNSFAYCNGG